MIKILSTQLLLLLVNINFNIYKTFLKFYYSVNKFKGIKLKRKTLDISYIYLIIITFLIK
jgi:hypothetical protein